MYWVRYSSVFGVVYNGQHYSIGRNERAHGHIFLFTGPTMEEEISIEATSANYSSEEDLPWDYDTRFEFVVHGLLIF